MTSKDFVLWLQGALELSGAKTLGPKETKAIADKLKTIDDSKPIFDGCE